MVEDAEAEHEPAAHAGSREEDVALALDLVCQARVDPLQHGLVGDAARMAAEGEHAERGRRHELELVVRLDVRLRVQRQVEAAVDRVPKRGDAEVAQRDPELEGAAGAGELEAAIGEVHLDVERLRVVR